MAETKVEHVGLERIQEIVAQMVKTTAENRGKPHPCKLCGEPWVISDKVEGYSDDDWRVCDKCWFRRAQERSGIEERYLKARITDFKDAAFQKKLQSIGEESIFMWGGRGRGKTHAVAALANHVIYELMPYRKRSGLKFLPWGELKVQWTACFGERKDRSQQETEDEMMKRLLRYHILVLDDFSDQMGAESYGLRFFLAELIDRRYSKQMVTWFTSNLEIKDVAVKFEQKVADRILEMCGPKSKNVIHVNFKNRRQET